RRTRGAFRDPHLGAPRCEPSGVRRSRRPPPRRDPRGRRHGHDRGTVLPVPAALREERLRAVTVADRAPAIVAFDGVDVAYRDRLVLREVSFQIARGERVAIVGPNGAGKSSLLRALAGLVPTRQGTILLEGRPIAELSRPAIARRISAVPAASLPFSM